MVGEPSLSQKQVVFADGVAGFLEEGVVGSDAGGEDLEVACLGVEVCGGEDGVVLFVSPRCFGAVVVKGLAAAEASGDRAGGEAVAEKGEFHGRACWMLDVGWFGVGCLVLGVGCWVFGVGCWVLGEC